MIMNSQYAKEMLLLERRIEMLRKIDSYINESSFINGFYNCILHRRIFELEYEDVEDELKFIDQLQAIYVPYVKCKNDIVEKS